MIRRYFEEEMRYLHEAGKTFAEVHPEQARMLNIDSLTDRDPYVERLFEGFAFLTGRIRERLDDELPQYTESLLRLLHPHFLKPVPSLSILEFTPRPGMIQHTTVMGPGTEVRSSPVGRESTVCRFATAYPVALQPFRLSGARLDYVEGASRATLCFQLDRGVEFDKLDLKRLRLYFHAEPATASTMHLFFTRHVNKVVVRAGERAMPLYGQQWVDAVGLREDEGLLPYSPHSFVGYRLLQEYFCFRPKFWFADLLGLDRLQPAGDVQGFEVEIYFDEVFPENKAVQADNIRLYCTPIVNLFETDAEPIRVEHRASEYRVVGEVRRPQSVSVYDISGVTGIEDGSGKRFSYKPYFAFEHTTSADRYYVETARVGPSGKREVFISAGGFGDTVTRMPAETFSLTVRCTNGNLPREALLEGGIDQPAPGFPSMATFRNLTQPSRELQPPLEKHPDLFWKLISHLAFNQMSVASREALVGLLELYEWTESAANERRIAGVRNVSWKPKDRALRGAVIRGGEVTIEVQDGHFTEEGDLNLFGTVLSAFLSAYATINSFVDLVIVSMPSGKRYEWIDRKGTRPLL